MQECHRCGREKSVSSAKNPVKLITPLTLNSDGPYRFRKLALVYHPDRNASDTAKQDFLQICEAYDILSNRELPAQV